MVNLQKAIQQCTTFTVLLVSIGILSSCVTTTNDEARLEFADQIKRYGTNPYVDVALFKDLERRIQAIAVKREEGPNRYTFGPRQLEILANFSDQYDHAQFEHNFRLARTDFNSMTLATYPEIGNEADCKIDTANARFPRDTKQRTPVSFDWKFMHGECENGLAHGRGLARAPGGTVFVGEFDQGQMIRGIFETTNINGERFVAIGDVPSTDLIGRTLMTVFRKNGYQWTRFGDFDGQSELNGFGMVISGYTDMLSIYHVGGFKDHQAHGFGARQIKKPWGDGKIWNAWIGVYRDNLLNGAGAWSNNADNLKVGEWQGGFLHGVGYAQYNDPHGDYHMFDACNYQKSKRQGMCKVFHSNSFNSGEHVWERYNNGEMIDASYHQTAFSLSQILAFSMGAAIIGATDAPSAAKMQVGQALFQDTLGGGGGSNLAALKQSYEEHAQRASSQSTPASSSTTSSSVSAGSGLMTEQVNISCPSGVSNTIPITYRTRACYVAAKQFAETYSCNKFDYERVAINCQRLCGHPQCLQK